MKKLLTRLALLMILCAALALPVFADAVTDSISVCITAPLQLTNIR